LGHLQCQNDVYDFVLLNTCKNETIWSGDVVHKLQGDHFALGLPFYRTCNITPPPYVKLCQAHMYYVVHKQNNLIRISIHLGTHDHLMAKGRSRKVFKQVKSLVEEEASCTQWAIASTIALIVSKILLEHLLNKDGQGLVEVFKGDKLCQVMDKFIVLSSPNVWNLIVSFKHQPRNTGYVSNIFVLKANNG